jgi:hypothetical protein
MTSVLRASPFLLTYGQLVIATVRAKNLNGWSSDSPVNIVGATIQTEPSQMSAPVKNSLTNTA